MKVEQYFNLPTIISVLGLISLFGGAAGYYKASRGDSIIKYHEKEGALKDSTIARLEKETVAAKAKEEALIKANEKLEEHVAFLQGLAQGSPELKTLADAVKNNTEVIKKFFISKVKK